MSSKPVAILRFKWRDFANAQPAWPDNAYTGCFLPIRPTGASRTGRTAHSAYSISPAASCTRGGWPVDGGAAPVIATRGGSWSCALLSETDGHQFFAHEYGHLLNFDHSWGRSAGTPAEYAEG